MKLEDRELDAWHETEVFMKNGKKHEECESFYWQFHGKPKSSGERLYTTGKDRILWRECWYVCDMISVELGVARCKVAWILLYVRVCVKACPLVMLRLGIYRHTCSSDVSEFKEAPISNIVQSIALFIYIYLFNILKVLA